MNVKTRFNTLFEESKNHSESNYSSSDVSNVHIMLDSDREINTPNLSSVEKPSHKNRRGLIPNARSKSSGKLEGKLVPRISETLSQTLPR